MLRYVGKCIIQIFFHKVVTGENMNKLQKICLLITILGSIDFALDVLLNMSFIIRFLPTSSVWYEVYAFVIGICGFVNITLYSKKDS